MLTHAGHALDVVYYEVLDMPLPALELLKTMRVRWLTGSYGMRRRRRRGRQVVQWLDVCRWWERGGAGGDEGWAGRVMMASAAAGALVVAVVCRCC